MTGLSLGSRKMLGQQRLAFATSSQSEKAKLAKEKAREKKLKEKEKEQLRKQNELERKMKARERERELKLKEKEKDQLRKQNERERKMKAKERERELKEKEKEKKRKLKERERLQKQKEREKAQKLAKKSKNEGRPKRPATAFSLYVKENMPILRQKSSDTPIPQLMAQLASQWRSLGAAEREPFERQASEVKKVYEEQMTAWRATLPPKKPLKGYLLFAQQNREETKRENPSANIIEIARILGKKWNSLSDSEKESFKA